MALLQKSISTLISQLIFITVTAAIGKELAALRSSGDIDVAKIAIRTTRPSQVPCTLHPAPCTLHPAPCTLHRAPLETST